MIGMQLVIPLLVFVCDSVLEKLTAMLIIIDLILLRMLTYVFNHKRLDILWR